MTEPNADNILTVLSDVTNTLIVDLDRTWAENCSSFSVLDLCNCQTELFCGLALCKSTDLSYLHGLKQYRGRKLKELIKKLLANSEEDLICDHIWYSYNTKTYLDNAKKALGELLH